MLYDVVMAVTPRHPAPPRVRCDVDDYSLVIVDARADRRYPDP